MNSINTNYTNWDENEEFLKARVESIIETDQVKAGKRLIIWGFITAVVGIVIYCTFAFSAESAQTQPSFLIESLAVVGAGVLLWFVGAIKYISAAIDSNHSSDELF